jgi:hypothetical protein
VYAATFEQLTGKRKLFFPVINIDGEQYYGSEPHLSEACAWAEANNLVALLEEAAAKVLVEQRYQLLPPSNKL